MHANDAARTLARCRLDPVFFAETVLGVTLWSKQREILESVRDNRRTAVRSCRGVGKTFVAAVIVLWFLYTHPGAKVITTAPTWRQVKDLLWSEIRALHARAERNGYPLGGDPTATMLQLDPDWFATGIASNIVENFLGYHAPSILFLVDEASGVTQDILDAAKGYATNADSYEVLVGNGTQTSGGLYDAFNTKADQWNGIHASAFHSPNMTRAEVARFPRVLEYMERHGLPYASEVVPPHVARALPGPQYVDDSLADWGEGSPLFDVMVRGEFPGEGENSVCGLTAVRGAQERYAAWEPTPGAERVADVQCDVARYGDDETAISRRDIDPEIDRVSILEVVNGRDLMGTVGAIIRHVRDIRSEGVRVRRVVVDDAGVGGGVVDRLRELQRRQGTRPAGFDPGIEIVAFNGGQSPRAKNDYPNRRSEAWFAFAEQLGRMALDPDRKLLADLVAPTYALDSRGRRVVEKKSETKKRLNRSPDRADTVLMGFAPVGGTRGVKAKRRVYQ